MTDMYDRDGQPISHDRWLELWSDNAYKILARTTVPGSDIHVSTVYLGLDHSFGSGPPLIFETMIFGGGDELNEMQWRYPTEAAALAGHDQAVALATEKAHR